MYNGEVVGLGNGFAPIGAAVHIVSATTTPSLRIDITVEVSPVSTLETVTPIIKENVMLYINQQIRTWGNQVKNPYETASIIIREAFIYAAALVSGVSDVTDVEIRKGGVVYSGQASWNTTKESMEFIDVDSIVINVSE
jgi:hypothetical protein